MNDSSSPQLLAKQLSAKQLSAKQLPAEDTVAIVGVGLLGGSIAAGLKQRGFTGRILGVGRNDSRLSEARQIGIIDDCTTNLEQAARESSLIIFCTPVNLIVGGVREAANFCQPGTLISDVGSIKRSICNELYGSLPPDVTFIGSHPLAGSEKNGFEFSDPGLFEDRICIVTPGETTPADQLLRLKEFWQSLGSRVIEISPEDHDRALAETSHLPHLIAAALSAALSESNSVFAATGLRDATRIAAGDPDLWTAILLDNAEHVLAHVSHFDVQLAEFRKSLENRDAAALQKLLQIAKTNRDRLSEMRLRQNPVVGEFDT